MGKLYARKCHIIYLFNNLRLHLLLIGGESIPDNPLDDLNGVNGTGPLYSR